MATEQAPTCTAEATIIIGRFTEANVTCGRELHGPEEAHLTREPSKTTDGGDAAVTFTWF